MYGMAVTPTSTEDPTAAECLKKDTKSKVKMVQEFMVLRCYQCETFQVHQVKKVNKWNCKCCNEKQSIAKMYGKGKAGDCRKHVQKLNMMRGEREQDEGVALLGSQHPPEDYASTFSLDEAGRGDKRPDYPVVVAGKSNGRSKWTTFIEVQDSDDEEGSDSYTTDKAEFVQASKKVRRSESDRVRSRPTEAAKSTPYSMVSQEMEKFLDENTPTISPSKSLHTLTHESYRRLDAPKPHPSPPNDVQSRSMFDLRSHSYHDNIESIRQDISRFSRSPEEPADIPKTSSRWSKFMCSEEENGDEGGSGRSLIASKSTVEQSP